MMMKYPSLLVFLKALSLLTVGKGNYVPGVAMKTFKEGDNVELKVNAITSTHTQIPKDYYRLPYCKPDKVKMVSENLGEFLVGDKIENSPYDIQFLKDAYCKILCQSEPLGGSSLKELDDAIREDYHHNWIIDNLPSYGIGHSEDGEEIRHYGGGFPVGAFVHVAPETTDENSDTKKQKEYQQTLDKQAHSKNKFKSLLKDKFLKTFVYNHARIVIEYHNPDVTKKEYRIVGFGVEPMSIKHVFENDYKWDGKDEEGKKVKLQTCDAEKMKSEHHHLAVDDISTGGQPVEEGQSIIFTYDVVWKESPVVWASRWDVYLNEGNMLPKEGHWFSVMNSFMVVMFLTIFIALVMVRTLKADIAGYNAVFADEEMDEDLEETGWKLIHADVFRPPSNYPMLFCVIVGSGTQVLLAAGFSLFLATFGLLSPARRGSLMTTVLTLFCLSGIVGGYVSARIYKSFQGKEWQKCTIYTATLFPGLCFGIFLFFNIYTAFLHSSLSVPFLDVLLIMVLFGAVLTPLVFGGAFLGYKQEAISFPTNTSSLCREIPQPPLYLNPLVAMIGSGFIPFSAAFVEMFFVMGGLWMGEFYYIFGFLFIVSVILVITCAEMAILLSYFQFCAENHRWHWFSLISGGSVALYMILYSLFYFQRLEVSSIFFTYMLYFGYMSLLCIGMFLAMGAVGFLSVLWFSRTIFGSIKVD